MSLDDPRFVAVIEHAAAQVGPEEFAAAVAALAHEFELPVERVLVILHEELGL